MSVNAHIGTEAEKHEEANGGNQETLGLGVGVINSALQLSEEERGKKKKRGRERKREREKEEERGIPSRGNITRTVANLKLGGIIDLSFNFAKDPLDTHFIEVMP